MYRKLIKYGRNIEVFDYQYAPLPLSHIANNLRTKDPTKRSDNVYRCMKNFIRLVQANLDNNTKPLLLLFTYRDHITDLGLARIDFNIFIRALRVKYGDKFTYIVVPEPHKSGVIHFHALFWYLPVNYWTEFKSHNIENMWGHGFVKIRKTDGADKIAKYLAKYMAKAFVNSDFNNRKAYITSKNIKRPEVEVNGMITPYLYGDWSNAVLVEREYKTRWCGDCKHRLYTKAG